MGKKSVQLRNKVTSSPTSASNEAEVRPCEAYQIRDDVQVEP